MNYNSLILMVILLIISAFFSSTESAFSFVNKTRLKNLAEKGNKKAANTLKLTEQYDNLLSTILIGNNIVNIALSSVATLFFVELFITLGRSQVSANKLGSTVSTVVVTIAVLIFAEITPKSIAKEFPEKFAMFATPIIKYCIIVFVPFTIFFGLFKKLVLKLFKAKDDRRMTQDELLTLVNDVEQEGGIDEQEGDLLRSAIEFTDRESSDILTPRTSLETVSYDYPNEQIARTFNESGYSRLPVYNGTIDNIVGIINQKDFMRMIQGTNNSIDIIMKKPVYIPLSMKISDILKLLQKEKSHMAIVIDEYGGTMGIVTMEDILEELVGEIWDEHDEIVENFTQINDKQYKVLCSLELDKLFKFYDLHDETDSATVNGWVLEKFGRFPEVGDSFSFDKITVETVKVDDQKVNEIIVTLRDETDGVEE